MTKFTDKLDEVLEPAFTDGKGVVYSLRLDEARQQILEAIGEVLKDDKRKPTHGTCCTCQDCGYPNDNECRCTENEVKARLRQALGITKGGADE